MLMENFLCCYASLVFKYTEIDHTIDKNKLDNTSRQVCG